MIKFIDNHIYRDGEKIGWIEENRIFSREGKKLGYFSDNHVFDVDGHKLGYIEGDFLHTTNGQSIRLEDNREHVMGGAYSDVARAAVRILLGD